MLKNTDWSARPALPRSADDSIQIIVYLGEGFVSKKLDTEIVARQLKTDGFIVVSKSRPGTKFDGQHIDGTQHDLMHFNVRTTNESCWRQKIRLSFNHKENGKMRMVQCALEYAILDKEMD